MLLSYAIIAAKIIIFISIANVWLFRFHKPTPWRGGNAKFMKEEFEAYGLPPSLMYVVGFIKLALAVLVFISIWIKDLGMFAAGGMAVFMLGAIAMHFKANDPNIKSFPALILLVLSIAIVAGQVVLDGV